jgi:integrase
MLTATLGLRKGEELGLDFDGRYLTIERQWTASGEYAAPKTKAGMRWIALPSARHDQLIALRLRSQFYREDDPIFASEVGEPSTTATSRSGVSRRRGKRPSCPISDLPPLRDAAASRLIRAGLDPVTVASVLGHEDATTTLSIDAHLFDRRRTDEGVRDTLAGGSGLRRQARRSFAWGLRCP